MAKISTTSLSVVVAGDGVSESYTPPGTPITNAAAPAGGPLNVTLSTGDNTLTVPTGAVAALVVPPTTSTVTKKIKGAAGDTGVTIASATPMLLPLGTGTASFILNASAGETIAVHWL